MKIAEISEGYDRWREVLALLHQSFAYMEDRLRHPAKATLLREEDLRAAAQRGTALIIEEEGQPIACLFCRPSRDIPDALYLGWLAVAETHRGAGLARALVAHAENRARSDGFAALTLDTGRALDEVQAVFTRLGFVETENPNAEADIITMIKPLDPA